jgi:hypothetical protein
MKQILICKRCGEKIEAEFSIEIRDSKPVGLFSFPKRTRMNSENDVFCGYCDTESNSTSEPFNREEQQIKALWDKQEKVCDYANGIREGIRQTLSIIGIKYEWLKGAK